MADDQDSAARPSWRELRPSQPAPPGPAAGRVPPPEEATQPRSVPNPGPASTVSRGYGPPPARLMPAAGPPTQLPPAWAPSPPAPRGPGSSPWPGAPPAAHPAPPGRRDLQIALWGGPSSGKSTYLWTLPTAARANGWNITPLDGDSEQFLVNAERALVKLQLPVPTAQVVNIRWTLERQEKRSGRFGRTVPGARIQLRTVERPGGDFDTAVHAVVEELIKADGIIYLFDADNELNPDAGANVDFFKAAMAHLQLVSAERGLLVGGASPHRLAVCLTKFDAGPIFAKAREGLWVTQSATEPFLPEVAPRDAAPFFAWLCRREFGDAAEAVRSELEVNFRTDRLHYFITSAIGFRVDGDQFNLSNPSNLAPGGRGLVHRPRPINVLEPLVALSGPARPPGRRR